MSDRTMAELADSVRAREKALMEVFAMPIVNALDIAGQEKRLQARLDEFAKDPLFTQPIVYRRPPLWKVVRFRLELAWSNAVNWIESAFRRLCNRLDAHPVVVLLLLACSAYVGVLVAQMARLMAMGNW